VHEDVAQPVGKLERLIGHLPLYGRPYRQRKAGQRANAKLFNAYGKAVDEPVWDNHEFSGGQVSFTCQVGMVPIVCQLKFALTPDGQYAVLWPFKDGALLPVDVATLEQLRQAIESCSTVIFQATVARLQAIADESSLSATTRLERPAAVPALGIAADSA
jgi:hypothetical protein